VTCEPAFEEVEVVQPVCEADIEEMERRITHRVESRLKQRWHFKQNGLYTFEARKLFMKLAPHVSANKLPRIVRTFLDFAGVKGKHQPSRAVLGQICLEMRGLAMTQVAERAARAKHRCLTWDGSKDKHIKNMSMHIGLSRDEEGDDREGELLFCGFTPMESGTAEHGKDAIVSRLDEIKTCANVSGVLQNLLDNVHIAMFDEGFMTDHAPTEAAIANLIKEEIRKWIAINATDVVEGSEHHALLSAELRAYCYEHKIDNIAKILFEAFDEITQKGDYLPRIHRSTRHAKPSAKTWMFAAHKLLGRSGGTESKANDLNMHLDFVIWLKKHNDNDSIKLLKSLGALVGERFWSTCKAAAMLYALMEPIQLFMHEQQYLDAANRRTENQLKTSVRTLSTFSIEKPTHDIVTRMMAKIVAEKQVCSSISLWIDGASIAGWSQNETSRRTGIPHPRDSNICNAVDQ